MAEYVDQSGNTGNDQLCGNIWSELYKALEEPQADERSVLGNPGDSWVLCTWNGQFPAGNFYAAGFCYSGNLGSNFASGQGIWGRAIAFIKAAAVTDKVQEMDLDAL